MEFKRLDDDWIEIFPGESASEEVLEAMARLSYETAESPAPLFVQPFDVPPESVDFASLVREGDLRMDYLNGRLCSTVVERREGRLLFNASGFQLDRGSPQAFLSLLQGRLQQAAEETEPVPTS